MLDEFNAAAPVGKPGNTVLGYAESEFRQGWIVLLSQAMLKTGKGFRMDSPNRKPRAGAAGWRGERRKDKVGTTKLERRLLTGGV